MSARRAPSVPPQLVGFSPIRLLGSGGFADVFLYEEQLLKRKVAVKVLLSGDLAAGTLENFTNEANLMAQLSNHPSIVSVYQAGISPDGRPFIVMEYCSRPNLQARYRSARFSEAEALKVGVQIAGAVETAHRGGILHRDIKPANVLVTDYGRPALTDFGIAAATGSDAQGGLSVPWAPPESFATRARGDARSDVYSLAATLYTLLAGRTPFELPGGSNTSVDVMGRIQSGKLPSIGRADVSASLERVLATAMAKEPGQRYQTAMEFAHALQRVQIELGIQPTTVDVVDEGVEDETHDEDDGLTRIRGVHTLEAQAPARDTTRPGVTVPGVAGSSGPIIDRTQRGYAPPALPEPSAPPVDDTVLRAPAGVAVAAQDQPEVPTSPTRLRRGPSPTVITVGIVVVVLVGIVSILVAVFGRLAPEPAPAEPTRAVQPLDPANVATPVPAIAKVTGTQRGNQATFTWANPAPLDGDRFLWRSVEPGVVHQYVATAKPTATVSVSASTVTCIEVLLVRADGQAAATPTMGCVK